MNSESWDQRIEAMRAMLRVMTRALDRESPPSKAEGFELRALANAGLQLADAYFDTAGLAAS